MQSTFPSALPQLGTLGKEIEQRLAAASDGAVQVTFQEPGAIVPPLEAFDAVSSGAVQAAWSTPGYWTGKDPALALFSAVPFGPAAPEYYAWMRFGGGQELLDEIYADYDIKSLICGVIPPEASGWFRQEIDSVEDLQGLKMRFLGLGAKVMEKLGVSTQLLAGGDVLPALELGTIDAAEYSTPAMDLQLGLNQAAEHYYFPGWHQQSSMFELMMNKDEWEALSEDTQALIETVCEANVTYAIAEGEALQFKALQELRDKGVQIHEWSPEMLDAFRQAWQEVAKEEAANDESFAKVWQSLSDFRENYAQWRDLGYLQ